MTNKDKHHLWQKRLQQQKDAVALLTTGSHNISCPYKLSTIGRKTRSKASSCLCQPSLRKVRLSSKHQQATEFHSAMVRRSTCSLNC